MRCRAEAAGTELACSCSKQMCGIISDCNTPRSSAWLPCLGSTALVGSMHRAISGQLAANLVLAAGAARVSALRWRHRSEWLPGDLSCAASFHTIAQRWPPPKPLTLARSQPLQHHAEQGSCSRILPHLGSSTTTAGTRGRGLLCNLMSADSRHMQQNRCFASSLAENQRLRCSSRSPRR